MSLSRSFGLAVALALGAAVFSGSLSTPAAAHGPGWYGGGPGWHGGAPGWRPRPHGYYGAYSGGWARPYCRERMRWVDTPWGWRMRPVRVCG